MAKKFTLQKHERLKSKKLLDHLFEKGDSEFAFPIKLIYSYDEISNEDWPLLFGVTVPKKKVKSAVKRNLIKRRIREAYRLHKLELQEKLLAGQSKRLAIMLIYIESEALEYPKLERAVLKLLKKLSNAIPV